MARSDSFPVVVVALVLIGLGAAILMLAPGIQRVGLRMLGEPRNRIAAWSRDIAASNTSLRSIRASGAMCIGFGAMLLGLLAAR